MSSSWSALPSRSSTNRQKRKKGVLDFAVENITENSFQTSPLNSTFKRTEDNNDDDEEEERKIKKQETKSNINSSPKSLSTAKESLPLSGDKPDNDIKTNTKIKIILSDISQNIADRQSIQRQFPERKGGDQHNPHFGLDGCKSEFYEYLDHPADVILHAWGNSLTLAFENIVPCMFNYITDISTVQEDVDCMRVLEVEGHDLYSLLFNYLDEILSQFTVDQLVICRCNVEELVIGGKEKTFLETNDIEESERSKKEEENQKFRTKVVLYGEIFDLTKHPQGTEIKAITYSEMKIEQGKNRSDLYVIVDI